MSIVRDEIVSCGLSWAARGVIAYAMTHDEQLSVPLIMKLSGGPGRARGKGRESATAIMNELIVAGYASVIGRDSAIYLKQRIPDDLRQRVFERDGWRCVECGSTKRLTADHIVAERHGGKATLENLQTLCRPCNIEKGTKLLPAVGGAA